MTQWILIDTHCWAPIFGCICLWKNSFFINQFVHIPLLWTSKGNVRTKRITHLCCIIIWCCVCGGLACINWLGIDVYATFETTELVMFTCSSLFWLRLVFNCPIAALFSWALYNFSNAARFVFSRLQFRQNQDYPINSTDQHIPKC